MGGGIVQTAAQAGFDVKVSEVNEAFLSKGLNTIKSNLSRNVEKGRMTKDEMDAVLKPDTRHYQYWRFFRPRPGGGSSD